MPESLPTHILPSGIILPGEVGNLAVVSAEEWRTQAEMSAAALLNQVLLKDFANEFTEAIGKANPLRPYELLLILPGDPRYDRLRHVGALLEWAAFAHKEGEDFSGLQQRYDKGSTFSISARWQEYQGRQIPVPLAGMRMGMPVDASFNDIGGAPWYQDLDDIRRKTLVPDLDDPSDPPRLIPLPDPRDPSSRTLEIATINLVPRNLYPPELSRGRTRASNTMYRGLCDISRLAQCLRWCTMLDKSGNRVLEINFAAPLGRYAGDADRPETERLMPAMPYYAAYDPVGYNRNGGYSNLTIPLVAPDVPGWAVRLWQQNRANFDMLFGVLPDDPENGVRVTILGDQEAFRGEQHAAWVRALGRVSLVH